MISLHKNRQDKKVRVQIAENTSSKQQAVRAKFQNRRSGNQLTEVNTFQRRRIAFKRKKMLVVEKITHISQVVGNKAATNCRFLIDRHVDDNIIIL